MSDLSRSLRAGAKYGTEDLRRRERAREIIRDLIDEGIHEVGTEVKRLRYRRPSVETLEQLIQDWWGDKREGLSRPFPGSKTVAYVMDEIMTAMVELYRSPK